MRTRNLIGYLMGLVLFVILIPLIMWRLSGEVHPNAAQWICFGIMAVTGISLSIWSIVYMKKVGEGNPFDAYNHEVAPRTKHLMTSGPYSFSRNPMLLGIYIYDIGVMLWLCSLWPLIVFAVEVVLLTLQVRSEEKRLEADFGEEYRDYKKRVPRYLKIDVHG